MQQVVQVRRKGSKRPGGGFRPERGERLANALRRELGLGKKGKKV